MIFSDFVIQSPACLSRTMRIFLQLKIQLKTEFFGFSASLFRPQQWQELSGKGHIILQELTSLLHDLHIPWYFSELPHNIRFLLINLMISKQEIISFLKSLREKVLTAFQALETKEIFVRTPWEYTKGSGGGEIGLLRGQVFEKAAVNWSGIEGEHFPMQDGQGPFFATGLSLITHMSNPHAPTVHMNLRYIETQETHWFGGGYDLTPMGIFYEEDRAHFHRIAQDTLAPFGVYSTFAQNAKEYFYIPHYQKERGVGGIFFDHYNTENFEEDFTLWKAIGDNFLQAILPIYERRIHLPFTEIEKDKQLKLRGQYVEFNLLYDRGTKFGFLSGGNPSAILCSLPPLVKW